MDILRIATAGSVDDGKSTLIGRLLHDTGSIPHDKLEALEAGSRRKGLDFTDLSLLTDGLIAEREQGITIDVAHIYFATATRKFIIADTPGHIEYTRNMITGASNAQASIVLVDARNGVIEQTRRHLFLSALLRLDQVLVCVNKMDLVGFDQAPFRRVEDEVRGLAESIGFTGTLVFLPIVARDGDNIVTPSARMPWYAGATLLHYLEALPVQKTEADLPARFPVQLVLRPHTGENPDYRGFAGRLASGALRTGDAVQVLPSGRRSRIRRIARAGQEVALARAGDSVAIELADDVDVSRGSMIVADGVAPEGVQSFAATLSWLDEAALVPGRSYLLQHGTNRVKAKVQVQSVLDVHTLDSAPGTGSLALNDIASVGIRTAAPLFADSFARNRRNGAFILIDEFTNRTAAVGIIASI